ncbi:MAG: hypothetical protein ABSG96_18105 [Terracidiphilus sp.]|jgi:hypothetical protein
MDEFERDIRQAFERRPAPPGLKRKLMEKRRTRRSYDSFFTWQRLAASLVLAAVLAGGFEWRNIQERRKEEAAREQVMTALRITSHALNRMNARLAARRRSTQD